MIRITRCKIVKIVILAVASVSDILDIVAMVVVVVVAVVVGFTGAAGATDMSNIAGMYVGVASDRAVVITKARVFAVSAAGSATGSATAVAVSAGNVGAVHYMIIVCRGCPHITRANRRTSPSPPPMAITPKATFDCVTIIMTSVLLQIRTRLAAAPVKEAV